MTVAITGKHWQQSESHSVLPDIVSVEDAPYYVELPSSFQMAALQLDWHHNPQVNPGASTWNLPLGMSFHGPLPSRFGIELLRVASDHYILKIVWDRIGLAWTGLTRAEIKATSLPDLLDAIGTELDYLLDQPVIRS